MTTSNRLLNFKNINREKYEYLEPEKSENGSYVSSCIYNLDGENKLGYYFECPRVVTPTGIYKSSGKYMMDVIIPLGSSLLEYLLSEDEYNMKATSMNSEDWFGEHFPLEVVQEKYNSALVFQNGNPILKLCIPTYQGKPMCEVFDNNRNLVNTKNVQSGSEIALILEKVGLRFLKETFVGEYTAHKIKIFSNQKINQLPSGYLFEGEEEEGEALEGEEGEALEGEEGREKEELELEEGEGEELELEEGEERETLESEEGEELELELEEGEELELEEESEESEEELLTDGESEFGEQLTDEELELEFSEDEGLTSEDEKEENNTKQDIELEQDLNEIENELDELELNSNTVMAEGGESEELETGDELEFNPAELTDEELELNLSEESESEESENGELLQFNPVELTDEELELTEGEQELKLTEDLQELELSEGEQELELSEGEQELELSEGEQELELKEDLQELELKEDLQELELKEDLQELELSEGEQELELSNELNIDLEEKDLKSEIREDVAKKNNGLNFEELKDEDIELNTTLI